MDEDIRVQPDMLYWVKRDNTMQSFTNEKQFLKLFPGKEESIRQYIKKNKLKFDKRNDLLMLWKFCDETIK